MNKKQGNQMQFPREKRLERRKWIIHSFELVIAVEKLCYKMG